MGPSDTRPADSCNRYAARVNGFYTHGSHRLFDRLYRRINRHALAPFFSSHLKINRREKGRILDVGAGSGHLAKALNLEHAVFADFSGGQIRRFKGSGFPGTFIQADLLSLPFASQRFDLVVCSNVLHYTGVAGLRELVRVAKPGGRLLLAFLEESPLTRACIGLAVAWGVFPDLMQQAPLLRLSDLSRLNLTIMDSAAVICWPPLIQAYRHMPLLGLVALVCTTAES